MRNPEKLFALIEKITNKYKEAEPGPSDLDVAANAILDADPEDLPGVTLGVVTLCVAYLRTCPEPGSLPKNMSAEQAAAVYATYRTKWYQK